MKQTFFILVVISFFCSCKKKEDVQPTPTPTGAGNGTSYLSSRYYLTNPSSMMPGATDTLYVSGGRITKLVNSSVGSFGNTYPITLIGDSVYINSGLNGANEYIRTYNYGALEKPRVSGIYLHLNFGHFDNTGWCVFSWYLLVYKAF